MFPHFEDVIRAGLKALGLEPTDDNMLAVVTDIIGDRLAPPAIPVVLDRIVGDMVEPDWRTLTLPSVPFPGAGLRVDEEPYKIMGCAFDVHAAPANDGGEGSCTIRMMVAPAVASPIIRAREADPASKLIV